MSAILKRVVTNSMKIKVVGFANLSHGKQIDTLAVRKCLQAQGVPSKKAEAITSALTKVLNDGLENVSDMPKNVKLQDPSLPTKFESLERLSLNIDKMNSKLLANLDKMNRDLASKVHQDFNEMVASLEAGRYEFDARMIAAKNDVVKLRVAVLVLFSALVFAIIHRKHKLSNYTTR